MHLPQTNIFSSNMANRFYNNLVSVYLPTIYLHSVYLEALFKLLLVFIDDSHCWLFGYYIIAVLTTFLYFFEKTRRLRKHFE